jgi:hypothetical protein
MATYACVEEETSLVWVYKAGIFHKRDHPTRICFGNYQGTEHYTVSISGLSELIFICNDLHSSAKCN